MKSLIFKITVLTVFVFTTIVLILSIPGTYYATLSCVINKVDLVKEIKGKKIIFVGGSALITGLDSFLVEKELQMSVANTGLYGGLGFSLMSLAIEPYINPGDIIVVSLEYEQYIEGFLPNKYARKWFLVLTPKNSFRYVYMKGGNFRFLMNDVSDLLHFKLSGWIKNALAGRHVFKNGLADYDARFNKYGDAINEIFEVLNTENIGNYKKAMSFRGVDSRIAELNNFYNICKSKGAEAFLLFPAFPDGEYIINKNEINFLFDSFKQKLKMPILGSPEDFLFPYNYFSNDRNHLRMDGQGRKDRTTKIIYFLKGHIAQ